MNAKRSILLSCTAPLFLLAAVPAAAQSGDRIEGRVKKLESEMRAVQRKVFPGANEDYFEPEIKAPAVTPGTGIPASTPLSDLTARVNSLEQQLASLTGQIEENGFKVRQLEAALEKFRSDTSFRLTQLEGGAPPAPGDAGATAAPGQSSAAQQALPDDPEAAYQAAYAQVVTKDWPAAERDLQAFLAKFPNHARASNAQYWLGRTYFAQNQPVQAARILLENYQKRPNGERAPESLLWLGKSLMAFSPPTPQKACEAYEQLETSYGKKISQSLRTQLNEARSAARCG